MAIDDKTPRVTSGSLELLVVETLVLVFNDLRECADSPHVRELKSKARSYERTVADWKSNPPSGAQREAMFDLVLELHNKTTEAKRAAGGGVLLRSRSGHDPRDPR